MQSMSSWRRVSWLATSKEIRTAVAPLVNSQPREILETSALGAVEIDDAVFFFINMYYKIHACDIYIFFLAMKSEKL